MSHASRQELSQLLDTVEADIGRPITVEKVGGGRVNQNFKVTTDKTVVIVRLWAGTDPVLPIDRAGELRNTLAAADTGVAPRVIAVLPRQRGLVLEFIDGSALTASAIKEPSVQLQVADCLRRLHSGRALRNTFSIFDVWRRSSAALARRNRSTPEGYNELLQPVLTVEQTLTRNGAPAKPCHNDVMPDNFLEGGGELRLVDYEYAGQNDPGFDLGGVAAEADLTDAQLEAMVTRYLGESSDRWVARVQLWRLMWRYCWVLHPLAVVAEGMQYNDWDYEGWAGTNIRLVSEAVERPEFGNWLEAAV